MRPAALICLNAVELGLLQDLIDVRERSRRVRLPAGAGGTPASGSSAGETYFAITMAAMPCLRRLLCERRSCTWVSLTSCSAVGKRQKEYKDFLNRYEQGAPSEGYSDQEVLTRYGEVSHAVPRYQYAQAAQEALSKLSPEERARS